MQQPRQIRLALMTSPEVEAAIAGGSTTVVIPCGATEQHGAHLPLCVDTDHADRLSLMIAERIGNALVAPTIQIGCSSHHMGFAGTISLRNETFEAICNDYCRSLAVHGFRRLLLFSAHVGNCPVLADILPRLRAANPGIEIQAFSDSRTWIQTWKDAVKEAGGDDSLVGGHADIAETSFMLVLRPENVQMEHAATGRIGMLTPQEFDLMWQKGLRGVSTNGILGSALGASPEIGRHCLNRIATLLSDEFQQMQP